MLLMVLASNPVAGEPSTAVSAASVILSPSTINVRQNARFTVNVYLQTGTNVGGFEAEVTYDTTKVDLVATSQGSFLTSGGRTAISLTPQTSSGLTAVGEGTCPASPCDGTTPYTRVDTGVDAPGTLYSLTFKAKAAGNFTLGLQNAMVVDPSGNQLTPLTTQNASVNITLPQFIQVFDADGDMKTDIGVFRPSTRFWWLLQSTQNYSTGAPFLKQWGEAGDLPVVADFDGDGKTDLGLYRPGNHFWYILQSHLSYDVNQPLLRSWGESSDTPVVGDFDGDGMVDFGVYRPSTYYFFLLLSSKSYDIFQPLVVSWGQAGDIPITGDFDKDGKTDFGIFRASTRFWWLLLSTRSYDIFNPYLVQWGEAGDVPVVGDFDADGQADFGVYRGSNAFWYLLLSTRTYDISNPLLRPWGGDPTDKPVVGDFDGDTQADFGVFRDNIRFWFVLQSGNGYDIFNPLIVVWGDSGDVTIPFPQPTSAE